MLSEYNPAAALAWCEKFRGVTGPLWRREELSDLMEELPEPVTEAPCILAHFKRGQ